MNAYKLFEKSKHGKVTRNDITKRYIAQTIKYMCQRLEDLYRRADFDIDTVMIMMSPDEIDLETAENTVICVSKVPSPEVQTELIETFLKHYNTPESLHRNVQLVVLSQFKLDEITNYRLSITQT